MEEIARLREANPPYAAELEKQGVPQGDKLAIPSAGLRLIIARFDPDRVPKPGAGEVPCGKEPLPARPRYTNREQEKAICHQCPDLEGDRCVSLACGMCVGSKLRIKPWENLPKCPAGEWL
jgi:hypothetical protein